MPTLKKTDVDKSLVLGATKITVSRSAYRPITQPMAGSDIVCIAGFMPGEGKRYETTIVNSIDQALEYLAGGDLSNDSDILAVQESDIYCSLISCWSNGGKNVVLMRLGDLDEIQGSDDEKYQLVYDRLDLAYPLITDNQYIQYTVPVEAFAEGYKKSDDTFLDFMKQAAYYSAKAMTFGNFSQILLNTLNNDVTIILNNESLRQKEDWQFRDPEQSYCFSPSRGWIPSNDMYRFVAVPAGLAMFSYPEFEVSYIGGLAPAVAGLVSSLKADVSMMGRSISGARLLSPISQLDAERLSLAGFIPVGESPSQQRRRATGALILGDNTMAIFASDYHQEVVLRLTRRISLALRLAIEPYIGSSGLGIESEIKEILLGLVGSGTIKSYSYKFARDPENLHKLLVHVAVSPYLPVKVLTIDIVAGPFNA